MRTFVIVEITVFVKLYSCIVPVYEDFIFSSVSRRSRQCFAFFIVQCPQERSKPFCVRRITAANKAKCESPQKNKKLRNTTPQHFAHKTHIEPPRFYAKLRTLICNRLYIDFVPNKRIIMKANFKGKEINYGFNQGYDCRQ